MCRSNSSFIFVNKIRDNHQGNCPGCTELSLELQKVRIEMLSYEMIKKMLQEELYKKELPKNTESSEEEYVSTRLKAQPLKEDWSQVTSKKYRKKDVFNSNLIQIIPTTNNRYERLSNLKDEDNDWDI
jgi:hypothetical protein